MDPEVLSSRIAAAQSEAQTLGPQRGLGVVYRSVVENLRLELLPAALLGLFIAGLGAVGIGRIESDDLVAPG